MSGSPRWASSAPSRNRTSAWTIDVGCTTTSIPSYGHVEEPVGLDQLETLVRERRRVDRDLRPHAPGRMCERLGGRDMSPSSARERPRNGPPEAVRTSPATCLGLAPSRHWWSAECSLSTGSRRPSTPLPGRRCASSPAATRLSLFASASVTPCSSAQSVARTPAKPTIAFRTTSGSLRSSSGTGSPPTCTCSTPCSAASASSGVEPDWSAQSSRLRMRGDDVDRLPADRAGGSEQGDASHRARRMPAPAA